MLKLGLLRTAIYAETQAEGESQEGSTEAEVVPEPRGNRESRKWNWESGREGARIKRMPERICLGKGGRRSTEARK